MLSRYAGTCARTGRSYPAGTDIVKRLGGKWAIAEGAHVPNFQTVSVADRWRRLGKQIAMSGQCPDCKSTSIHRDTLRTGSIGSIAAWVCDECSFEVPDWLEL